jgi:transaldolase
VRNRIGAPVDAKIIAGLSSKFADFRRAMGEDVLGIDEFDSFGPTRRTLRQFIAACHELESLVRDVIVPNPDVA